MAPRWQELEEMPDDRLRELYDQQAGNTSLGPGFIREEMFRRQVNRSSERMEEMTLTVGSVGTAVVALVVALNS